LLVCERQTRMFHRSRSTYLTTDQILTRRADIAEGDDISISKCMLDRGVPLFHLWEAQRCRKPNWIFLER